MSAVICGVALPVAYRGANALESHKLAEPLGCCCGYDTKLLHGCKEQGAGGKPPGQMACHPLQTPSSKRICSRRPQTCCHGSRRPTGLLPAALPLILRSTKQQMSMQRAGADMHYGAKQQSVARVAREHDPAYGGSVSGDSVLLGLRADAFQSRTTEHEVLCCCRRRRRGRSCCVSGHLHDLNAPFDCYPQAGAGSAPRADGASSRRYQSQARCCLVFSCRSRQRGKS